VSPESIKVPVTVDGRELVLSNLAKVLYPEVGFAKGQVLDYYTRIAPVMLPHLRNRPITFKRYPNGVDGMFFFEKNAPKHRPSWFRTVTLASPGSTRGTESIDYGLIDDLPGLVWAANLAVLEFHTPLWRVDDSGQALHPDLLVFDLDPGAPADIVQCCEVAVAVRAVMAEEGLAVYPKTSGSKGMQVYVGLDGSRPWEEVHAFAKKVAQRLEKEMPELVVHQMKKDLRHGKVLVDWSQNNSSKTTISVYSMRARQRPTVSTPITWEEVQACVDAGDPSLLVFTTDRVLERVESMGDLFAPLLGDTSVTSVTSEGRR
jgi:bifunctional non-homologous end joining protein LigD